MSQFLSDPPLWILGVIAVVGIALLVSGNKRMDKALLGVGAVILLLAVALFLTGRFLESPKEEVERKTRQLVEAAEKRDWQAFQSVMDPKVTFWDYPNRDALVNGAKKSIESIELKSASITSLEVEQDQSGVNVTLNTTSVQDRTMGRPIPTAWRLEWLDSESDEGWLLYRVTALPTQFVKPEQIHAQLER